MAASSMILVRNISAGKSGLPPVARGAWAVQGSLGTSSGIMARRVAALGVGLLLPILLGTPRPGLAAEGPQRAAASPEWLDVFALPGERNILEEAHFGIVHGKATVGIPYRRLAAIDGLWAPPFVSTDFRLSVAIDQREPVTSGYVWRPHCVQRKAFDRGLEAASTTVLIAGRRAGMLAVVLRHSGPSDRTVHLSVSAGGTLDRSLWWEFGAPRSATATRLSPADGALLLEQRESAIVVRAVGIDVRWDASTGRGAASLVLPPNRDRTLFLVFAVGPRAEAEADVAAVAADPAAALRAADATHANQVRRLFDALPRLRASNPALVQFYERSLVHFLTNRWDVPEFVLHPYYSTGSVRGGCVCNYLWNFGETWEILPLVDPKATREHIVQFLRCDMTRHFAFEPTTGRAFGPWYMVNQEKIIGLVYHYVRNTGDVAFLAERVDAKSILEHVVAHALHGDDTSKPVALIDYGPSNSHLELRRGFPYNHVMPDLNGRRCANYEKAAELIEVAASASTSGQPKAGSAPSRESASRVPPASVLRQRARDLATRLKQRLWNPRTRWFDFFDAAGKPDARYTVQIFKLFGGGVLDAETESGLLGHLNAREFLSPFGLHSLAKTDIAYDPADIDNGGPGSCTCFPPQIAERLYKAGHPVVADDLLRRILWWGERMPYWGDSIVADKIDYRRDTPLQCTLDGVAAAQCLLFGTFGITPQWDGGIRIHPAPSTLADRMELIDVRLRGQRFDVSIRDGRFEVRTSRRTLHAPLGNTIELVNGRLR